MDLNEIMESKNNKMGNLDEMNMEEDNKDVKQKEHSIDNKKEFQDQNKSGEEILNNSGSPYKQYREDKSSKSPYNEMNEGLRKKLYESKMARKKAEDDAKLIQNRIALLREEEAKAKKKIEETKKRASEILELKRRNEELARQKAEQMEKMQEELKKHAENNKNSRLVLKKSIDTNHKKTFEKKLLSVEQTKNEKANSNQMLQQTRQEFLSLNRLKKEKIKVEEETIKQKKAQDLEEKKARARLELEEKILKEDQSKIEKEAMVSKMEQEEYELIQKLQNTQLMQQEAYEKLEKAISRPTSKYGSKILNKN